MADKAGSYLQFLQSPSTGLLASNASLNYITTTTRINEPTAILKHLAAQGKQVVKKDQKVLHTIEGDNGCCIETETTLQFRMGGGAFLPDMDSNMLDEREVTLSLTHVVTWDGQGKIQQIRQYWDQGTLLKQVEAIGKTGRNWPIREGKDQAKAVASSVKAGASSGGSVGEPAAASRRGPSDVVISGHQKRDSVSVTRDPHSSLSLFAERDPNEGGSTYNGPKYEASKSAKPAPRDLGELFTNEENIVPSRSQSPHKEHGTILKAGAGRGFKENRLFDTKEDFEPPKSPERKKTYGQKYEHFAFGDGEDAPQGRSVRPGKSSGTGAQDKSSATFSFEDFATPPKHVQKDRPDYERHWGAGVDEEDPESPPKRPVVHQPRKDADMHWELNDESPAATTKVKSFQRQKGLGLYGDPLHEDDRVKKAPQKPNVNNARRGDDFEAHYSLTDNSPAGEKKIYKTAGDGMGSRSGGRAWGIGDESDPEIDADVRPSARSRGGRTTQARSGAQLDF